MKPDQWFTACNFHCSSHHIKSWIHSETLKATDWQLQFSNNALDITTSLQRERKIETYIKFSPDALLNWVSIIIGTIYALFPIIYEAQFSSFLLITSPIISKIYKLFSINRFLYYSVQPACYSLSPMSNPWLDKQFWI